MEPTTYDPDSLSILQYADDTILFMDHNLEQAKNMKLLLTFFEQLSGLKINFHKSEVFYYGEAKEFEDQYTELFGCKLGEYLWVYLCTIRLSGIVIGE